MRGPSPTPAPHRTQPSAFPARPGRNSRPIDRAIEAIERGVVTPSLFRTSRMQTSRITPGRGWGRHGHVASNARKTS
jgi:hypothetical protein